MKLASLMTEIKLNILDVCSSKMRRVIRCIPAMSNENILATRQEFFVPKAAPIQSITNLLVLDFWLMLLHLFIFLNVFYFSECECLDLFFGWKWNHQLSTYVSLRSYELQRAIISHSNLTTYKHWNEEKIWSKNSISIPMHPGIIYFWIWLSGGAAYQGGE